MSIEERAAAQRLQDMSRQKTQRNIGLSGGALGGGGRYREGTYAGAGPLVKIQSQGTRTPLVSDGAPPFFSTSIDAYASATSDESIHDNTGSSENVRKSVVTPSFKRSKTVPLRQQYEEGEEEVGELSRVEKLGRPSSDMVLTHLEDRMRSWLTSVDASSANYSGGPCRVEKFHRRSEMTVSSFYLYLLIY